MSNQTLLTVVTAAQSYDLIDLDTVKDELGLSGADTTNDAFLSRGITQMSAAAANYCNRVFPVEALSQIVWLAQRWRSTKLPYSDTLQLGRWPIVGVSSVVLDAGLDSEQTLTQGTDYLVDAALGRLLRIDSDTGLPARWCTQTVTVLYTAGYGSVTTQSQNVPSGSPPTITVTNATAFSIDQGVVYTPSGIALVAVAGNPGEGQYSLDAAEGEYTFNAADEGRGVAISYGYNTIPADLVDVVLRMTTLRFRQRGRDPMIMQQDQPGGVGATRYWVGGAPGQKGVFPLEIAGLLDNYSVPTVG